jgi:endonuclease/exonuclease/phosphatase (EEP) superfamily protein YafD
VVKTDIDYIRLITTHFTVSDLCTETPQMYDMSNMINSLVKHSKDMPTIFSADLNMIAESYSVNIIKQVLTCHTEHLTDTLSNTHRAKEKDFPEGLAVDHVFSKQFSPTQTQTVDIDFSMHKALITEFNTT